MSVIEDLIVPLPAAGCSLVQQVHVKVCDIGLLFTKIIWSLMYSISLVKRNIWLSHAWPYWWTSRQLKCQRETFFMSQHLFPDRFTSKGLINSKHARWSDIFLTYSYTVDTQLSILNSYSSYIYIFLIFYDFPLFFRVCLMDLHMRLLTQF